MENSALVLVNILLHSYPLVVRRMESSNFLGFGCESCVNYCSFSSIWVTSNLVVLVEWQYRLSILWRKVSDWMLFSLFCKLKIVICCENMQQCLQRVCRCGAVSVLLKGGYENKDDFQSWFWLEHLQDVKNAQCNCVFIDVWLPVGVKDCWINHWEKINHLSISLFLMSYLVFFFSFFFFG